MEEKFFLAQIKHTNNVWEKGVVVKETEADARQSYHAYFGAYGYNHDANTDYVQCLIFDIRGAVIANEIDNRLPIPEPPEPIEPGEE